MTKYLTLALALVAFNARAGEQLKVATGAADGTYSKELKEISKYCGSAIPIHEVNTGGSLKNIEMLSNNEVNAAFVQTDAWYLSSQTDDRLKEYKTLLAMHPEEVHVLALAQAKPPPPKVEKGTWGRKDKVTPQEGPVFTTIADLKDRTVGAVGGSIVTAKLINLQSQIGYKIRSFEKPEELFAALNDGGVDAAIFVGGQPLGPIAKLNGDYKLLKVDDDTAAKVKNVYRPARLNYANLGAAGVTTVSTGALLVTYDYASEEMVRALTTLRQCVYDNLGRLREETGNHPKWRTVKADDKGSWGAWYDPPGAKPATVKASGKKRG